MWALAIAGASTHATAQDRMNASKPQTAQTQAVATVSRVAHPYDPLPPDIQGAARVPQGPTDPYRRPYDQYLGGWSAPPPQLDSPYAPPAALAPLPQVQVAIAPPPQLAQAALAPAVAEPRLRYGEGSLLGVSELRFGVLAHNKGPFAEHIEHGAQVNVEARFRSPDFMKAVASPRPTLGFSANTAGDTSFLYAGLTWGGFVWNGVFLEGFLGLATHDGELDSHDPEPRDRLQFGSRLLFRGAVEVGYRFLDRHSISIMLDHYSNGGGLFAEPNQGNEDLGLRYGYKF